MKTRLYLVAIICAVFFAGSVFAAPKWQTEATGQRVKEARESTVQVEIAELKKVIDADEEDFTLLDVRTPREYEAFHIPGAVNVSRGLVEFSIWSVVPDKEEKIYVYCKSGARAALTTKMLNEFGYKNAVSIKTGMTDWAAAGYPVQTSITDEQLILLPVEE